MNRLACCIIAGQGVRATLLDTAVIPSVLEGGGFDEVVVIGTHHTGAGFRYLFVPDLTKTTLDALVKRDVATLATSSDVLVYLADDHALLPGFADVVRGMMEAPGTAWDVLVPARFADHPELGRIRIPNGEEGHYCAGHAGVFRRRVIQGRPWAAQRHDRLWDLYSSHDWLATGVRFLSHPDVQILDLEPENSPWA
jgi:hypothetical protein